VILDREDLMGWAYGIDLRNRVVTAIEGGLSHRQAAERFSVAISTAGNWHRLWRKNGSAKPGKQGKPSISKLDPFEAEILTMVEEHKDIALHEIAERLADKHGVHAARSTVWQFFNKRSITFKKNQAMPASSKGRMF
jgi:transposase